MNMYPISYILYPRRPICGRPEHGVGWDGGIPRGYIPILDVGCTDIYREREREVLEQIRAPSHRDLPKS